MTAVMEQVEQPRVKPLYWVDSTRTMHLNFHSGQQRAWDSPARTVMVLAGSQSGKTSWGPFWLLREIQLRGPGDYLIAAPTFKLLSMKLFPEFLKLFKTNLGYGNFTGRGSFNHRFLLNPYANRCLFGDNEQYWEESKNTDTQIFFGHAAQPDSLESATVKAAWLDEAGQKLFKIGSYEAVRRRLAINRGRLLITTTPYTLGWLKDIIFDPWDREKRAGRVHPTIDVINFRSTENPSFPLDEYEARKAEMPKWKFEMFYDGVFSKPAGAIYADFDRDRHTCRRFPIPEHWPRYVGLDFGGVHTAGVFLAKGQRDGSEQFRGVVDTTEKFFLYREYPERGRWESNTAAQHVVKMLEHEPKGYDRKPKRPKAYGGAKSEQQWRDEFMAGGLHVGEPPISEVEVGIDRVIACWKKDEIVVFEDCVGVLDHVQNYSRVVDEKGNVLEDIENKEDFHYCDALRYIVSYVRGGTKQFWMR